MKSVSFVCLLLSGAQLQAAPGLEPRACEPAAAAAGARRGLVYVPEDHARPRGRRIGLEVLALPATGPRQALRAQYDLEGGPEFAARADARGLDVECFTRMQLDTGSHAP